jgi:hypothetical protein
MMTGGATGIIVIASPHRLDCRQASESTSQQQSVNNIKVN